MAFKNLLSFLSLTFFFISFTYAQKINQLKSSSLKKLKDNISLDAELSLEYRKDQLRSLQNNETTNIRNLSLLANFFKDQNSNLTLEILGDENQTGDLNVNIGQLYYESRFSLFDSNDSNIKVGVMKLGYGMLNEIDGLFSVLPSYYNILYDLPRGLDTGLRLTNNFGGSDQFFISASVYAGKNMRQTDNKNREIDIIPHQFSLGWKPNLSSQIIFNYFSRKYESQPLVYGFGLEYSQISLLYFKGLNIDFGGELWSLTTSINKMSVSGLSGLIGPKFSYKKFFVQPYLGLESWTQGQEPRSNEIFYTGKFGYAFNQNIRFMLEQTKIENTSSKFDKESSLQARIVSQWTF